MRQTLIKLLFYIYILFFTFLFATTAGPAAYAGVPGRAGYAPPVDIREITLVHSLDYWPLVYVDEVGESKGVLVDYWKLWSRKTGILVRFEPNLWHACVERGRTDGNVVIPGLFHTPERDTILDFSESFFDIKTSLFFRNTGQAWGVVDLAGRKVGVTRGDRVIPYLRKTMPELELKVYNGFEDVMRDAVGGELDVFAMDNLCAQYFLHKHHLLDRFTAHKTLYVGKLFAAVQEGNHELLRMVNLGIQGIREEEVRGILAEWFARAELASRPVLSTFMLSSVAVVILVVLGGAFILKIQVRNRTRDLSRANRELLESEERFRRLNEAFSVGIIIHLDTVIQDANQVAAHMTGYSLEELTGMSCLELIDPDWQPLAREKVETGCDQPYEAKMVRKDGSTFFTEIQGKPTPYKGQPARVVEFRDITERRRVKEEKKQLEARLHRLEKMEALGVLAGGVAHDLNNILSGLVSYPELLLLDLPRDSHLRKPIQTMQKSGEKAAAIVQDLLTLARRGLSVTEVLDLNQIIGDYLKSPEFGSVKSFHPWVQVSTSLESDLLNIQGSPVHLSKTLMNLVSNAAEAMPDPGEITIATRNRYVDTPVSGYDMVEEGDYVTLAVSDTGTGIPPADRERIFEPFYTKKAMGRSGTGLGMAVVWGTVKDHKGYIDIQTHEGVGTTFTLYFPAARVAPAQKPAPVSISDYMGNGERVLVVDDVAEQREISSQILKKLGYEVSTVSSGEEAVAYLKTDSVDLLVLDMIMDPGMDGLETYQQIIRHRPGQKAIVASGFSETDRVREVQRLGVGQYVKKPYTLEKLGLAVKEELL